MKSDHILHLMLLKGRVSAEDWPSGSNEVWEHHLAYYDELAARLATRYDDGAYTFYEPYRATMCFGLIC